MLFMVTIIAIITIITSNMFITVFITINIKNYIIRADFQGISFIIIKFIIINFRGI